MSIDNKSQYIDEVKYPLFIDLENVIKNPSLRMILILLEEFDCSGFTCENCPLLAKEGEKQACKFTTSIVKGFRNQYQNNEVIPIIESGKVHKATDCISKINRANITNSLKELKAYIDDYNETHKERLK